MCYYIVIVDFIDMESNDHKNALHKYMQELMEADRAKHNVLPLTKFGLMQLTRQRIRPVTEINTMVRGPSPFPTAPSSGLHSCLLPLPLQAWGWSLTHALKCPQHSLLVSPAPPVLLLNVPQLPPGLDTCSLPRP